MVPLAIQNYLTNVSKSLSDLDLAARLSVVKTKTDPNELIHVILVNDPIRSDFAELVDIYLSTRFDNLLDSEERKRYESTVRSLFAKYYNPRCPTLQKRVREFLTKKHLDIAPSTTYVNETALKKIEKKMKAYISTNVFPRISTDDIRTLYDESDARELTERILWSPKFRRGFESLLEEYTLHAFPPVLSLAQYTDKLKCIDLFQKLYYSVDHPYLVPYIKKLVNLF